MTEVIGTLKFQHTWMFSVDRK